MLTISRLTILTAAAFMVMPALATAIVPTKDQKPGNGHTAIHAPELDVKASLTRYERGSHEVWAKPGLRRFFERRSADWEVLWDDRSNRPNLISGRGVPMLPGRGNKLQRSVSPTLGEVEDLVRNFMDDHPELFGVARGDLVLWDESSGNFGQRKQLWFVELRQHYDGVPVEGAVVFFRINNGNLVQFGSERLSEVNVPTQARIDSETALRLALEALGMRESDLAEVIQEGDLKIYPRLPPGESAAHRYQGAPGAGYHYLLVRESVFRVNGDAATYRALIDARSAKVIDLRDLNRYVTVRGGINLDPEEKRDFLHVTTSGDTTSLNGQYIRIYDRCGSISVSDSADGSNDGVIDLGMSDGTDCSTPGYGGAGNTHSARSGHYHLTQINRQAAEFFPDNSWLNSKLTAETNIVNLDGDCNAFWNGTTVNFYRSGSDCANTGELAAVLAHEWGHGMDSKTGGGSDYGSGEAAADSFAMIYLRTSCIGRGYQATPCHNCSTCTGVRDPADFSYHDGTATIASPATVKSNSGINCDRWTCPDATFPGVMGFEGHCESYIASSAIWDLGVELRNEYGEFGWEILEQIWYDSLIPSKEAYQISAGGQCNASASVDGCGATNYYQVFLMADDDDANLANGTPNACRIWDAFNYHGIACGSRPDCTDPCPIPPIADAGPDQTICIGNSVEIGTPALADHTYSWSPDDYPIARPTVFPSETTTYTVTASTAPNCFAQDSMTVTVESGTGGGLEEDFEGDTSGWTSSGLWHLITDSSCASPGYSSAAHAFYYGQDSSCAYDASRNSGDLISPSISGLTSSSTLAFAYFRQVESYDDSYDKAEVAVELAGSGNWTTIWSKDSTDVSENAWTTSEAIDLSAWAGSDIRIRFRFDTVDGSFNTYTGWLIDDVVVTGAAMCGGNTPPAVTITAPTDDSSYTVGHSVFFSGTATDVENGDLTSSLSWSSNLDGAIGSGGSFSTSTLSVGAHTITASVTDSGGLLKSERIHVTVTPDPGCAAGSIDFRSLTLTSYSNQNVTNGVAVENDGYTLHLTGNTWVRSYQTFNVTPNTVIDFAFASGNEGEIHAIGFDENNTLNDEPRHFQFWGTQNWDGTGHIDWAPKYTGSDTYQTYSIPVGQYYTGSMHLVLTNDNDSGTLGNEGRYQCVRIYGTACEVNEGFESDAGGWTNSGSSTCTTGTFVRGTPTGVANTGVTTQVGGAQAGSNALFTAVNTSAGVNDVDGGECILESPVYDVATASEVSIWYFHGQRDAGDDPSGDYFHLEVSISGGPWTSLVSYGDQAVNAVWTKATTAAAAGDTVQFRVRVSDGPVFGDLVEAGVDSVSICEQ
ncbi:MAG: hypothetical protein GY835_18395 [bacterium]|nr:hypothetical protein [bacterium]